MFVIISLPIPLLLTSISLRQIKLLFCFSPVFRQTSEILLGYGNKEEMYCNLSEKTWHLPQGLTQIQHSHPVPATVHIHTWLDVAGIPLRSVHAFPKHLPLKSMELFTSGSNSQRCLFQLPHVDILTVALCKAQGIYCLLKQ